MARSLQDILAERAAKKPLNQKARNRAAFLANMEEIRQALDNGWSVKDVWEALCDEGRIPFGYQAFLGYVKRLIRNPSSADSRQPVEETGRKEQVTKAPRQKAEGIKGFQFDPVPKKEELF